MKRDNGSSISDPEEVLQGQKSYYQNLYSSQNPQVDDPRFNKFFQNETIKTLDNEQKERCEGLLTDSECRYALKAFQKNKSPGTDCLTAEFYSFFWEHLSSTMINSFNYGFVKGELSISKRQGIIRLIPKKNKNLPLLKNWRPISLLNVDYKIATKALALRLTKLVIYIGGRFIGGNIRMISEYYSFHSRAKSRRHRPFYRLRKSF